MSDRLQNWLKHSGATLDATRAAPRGLLERLRFISDMVKAAGAMPDQTRLLYRDANKTVAYSNIGSTLTVGRDAQAGLVIPDPKISRLHVRITESAGLFSINDLVSRNGTWVNGERITQRVLRDGDIIEIGNAVLVFLNRRDS